MLKSNWRRLSFASLLACVLAGGLMADAVCAQATKELKVGDKAPDFKMTGIDGKEFKLSDRLGKDKSLVLLFDRAHW